MLTPTSDLELVVEQHRRDARVELDGLPGQHPRRRPQPPLPGAIVDEVLDPVRMLASHGAPEEALVSAVAAVPFARQPLDYSGQPDGVLPDLVDGELWPVGDPHILGYFALVLNDLVALEQLLHEDQRTIVLLRQ